MQEKVAVIIPCYNESQTIGDVINGFKESLPDAEIYVGDNNSSDNTSEVAKNNGAIVIYEKVQGKGAVFKSLIKNIEADIFIFVDGDNTYDPAIAPNAVKHLKDGDFDFLFINRKKESFLSYNQYFRFLGNVIFFLLFRIFLRLPIEDPLTGYRVFTKKFIEDYPFLSTGFTIETELNLFLKQRKFKYSEIWAHYMDRPEGSFSKLNVFADGFKILKFLIIYSTFKRL